MSLIENVKFKLEIKLQQ